MELELQPRESRPYVARRSTVAVAGVGGEIDAAMPLLRRFLETAGVKPEPPPFVRYLQIDMPSTLSIEVGVPLRARVDVNDCELVAGYLPSGEYAVATHVGPPASLVDAHGTFQDIARERGLVLAGRVRNGVEVWSGRFEFLMSDPESEPDPAKWRTELAYLVA